MTDQPTLPPSAAPTITAQKDDNSFNENIILFLSTCAMSLTCYCFFLVLTQKFPRILTPNNSTTQRQNNIGHRWCLPIYRSHSDNTIVTSPQTAQEIHAPNIPTATCTFTVEPIQQATHLMDDNQDDMLDTTLVAQNLSDNVLPFNSP